MSTDKLEKPKHNHSQQGTTHQTNSNPLSAPSTGSLPRRNANGVFYRTPQDFVGGSQQSNLRRNCSMNDLQQRNQDDQSSWLPAPPPQVRGGICPCRNCRRQCKIFASGVNFSIFTLFLCFFLLKLLKLGEIDGVKFLA